MPWTQDANHKTEKVRRFMFTVPLMLTNGDPYKAHIRDRDGRIWMVWFGSNEQIIRIVQGDQ